MSGDSFQARYKTKQPVLHTISVKGLRVTTGHVQRATYFTTAVFWINLGERAEGGTQASPT